MTVRKAFRSILAVLAGIAVLTAASFAIEALADPVMISLFGDKTRLAPSIFMYFYTAVCIAAGGYVTAWVAGRSPEGHALAMGLLQEALNVWAMVALPHQAPLRNWIVGLVMTIPAAWLGGVLRAKQVRRTASLAA
jgi:hypothetical protein